MFIISGTASINEKGEILYGRILKNRLTGAKNIEVLLNEAGCTADNLAYLLIYLRDLADFKLIEAYMQNKFSFTSKNYTARPVCRIRMADRNRRMAIRPIEDSRFKKF
jgi:enamine deaminase RidA (YjgF/YER057c/UK114 family)